MANEKTLQFWRKEISNGKDYMSRRVRTWQKLLKRYDLEFEGAIKTLPEEHLIKISRFYPMVRQIIATISFNYPRVFLRTEDEGTQQAGDLLERAANAAIRIMGAREEVQQSIFDALFCSVGWLKMGVNPAGDQAIAPYVTNDAFEEDFVYVHRVAPENILLDPLTPPHKLAHARYIIEKMWVPLEFVKEDPRYKNRRSLKPTRVSHGDESLLGGRESEGNEDQESIRKAIEQGDMVLLWEIHDRIHQKIYTLPEGASDFIEEEDHPFLRSEPTTRPDPITGEPLLQLDEKGSPAVEKSGGYLVQGGFQYVPIKFDHHGNSFYPEPPLAYVEDLQNLIVESLSRRSDILKRFSRVAVIESSEEARDRNIKDQFKTAQDGDLITVGDANSIKELNWGHVPSDQLNIEADARAYEEQSTRVSDLQQGGPALTATQASLVASSGSINREWMQSKVGDAFRTIVINAMNIFGDQRYTPEQFIINIAKDGQEPIQVVMERSDFLFKFVVEVQAGSMQPLIEQMEQDRYMQLYDRWSGNPRIDQTELDRSLGTSFRLPDVDRFFTDAVKAEAERSAQLENEGFLIQGIDPGAIEGQDHQTHMNIHTQLENDPRFQQLPPMGVMNVQGGQSVSQQLVIQARDQHMQQHQELLQQEMQVAGGGAPAPGGGPQEPAQNLISTVRSNAQNIKNAVTRESAAQTQPPAGGA